MLEDGDGTVHGRFTLSTLHGAMLKKMLYAIATRTDPEAGRDRHDRWSSLSRP